MTDYLNLLNQENNMLSDSYFKHTLYGLCMLFKSEWKQPHYIGFPAIRGHNKLSVVLSKQVMWRLLGAIDFYLAKRL